MPTKAIRPRRILQDSLKCGTWAAGAWTLLCTPCWGDIRWAYSTYGSRCWPAVLIGLGALELGWLPGWLGFAPLWDVTDTLGEGFLPCIPFSFRLGNFWVSWFEIAVLSCPSLNVSSSIPGRIISPKALGSWPDFLALSNAAATEASFGLPDPSPVGVAKGSTRKI